ncbi:MAG: metal-dependent hydrolase [Xanthomonadaceae bacterium]|nr:metal-dependent hydrolase [Xanthomonadaceae bacterium]
MDPVTQGLLGAAAAQAACGRRWRHAWLAGAVGGLIPDLDVLIRSTADPLLAIEYHRHFTHALAFIPVGGLIAAAPWLLWRRHRRRWRTVVAASILGYATHGLLDACTSYGTLLLWPFSTQRIAWDVIAIIDPIFTLVLLLGVLWAALRGTGRAAAVALLFCLLYLGAGWQQRERALEVQAQIAAVRGHAIERGRVFPTLGNQLVWRSLYQAGDRFYVDRIRVPWLGAPQWTPGSSVVRLSEDELLAAAPADPRVRQDFRRFSWFSDGWVARTPSEPEVIGDVRYSLRTDAFEPVWGIRFHPGAAQVTEWVDRSVQRDLRLATLWSEITGTHPDYRPLLATPALLR